MGAPNPDATKGVKGEQVVVAGYKEHFPVRKGRLERPACYRIAKQQGADQNIGVKDGA